MRAGWNRDGSSVSDHARAVDASIVVQPVVTGVRVIRDVRVLTGNALIHLPASLDEGDVVHANQSMPAIPHFDGSAQIDAVRRQ